MKFFKGALKQLYRSGRNRGRFLIYFISVNLLVASTMGILLYIRTSETIKRKTEEANQNMLIQISNSVDMLLKMVDQYTDQIPLDQDVISLPGYLNTRDTSLLIPINEKMRYLLNANDDIYDIAIYYVDKNKVFVVDNGVNELEDYLYKDILMSNIKKLPLEMKMALSFGVKDKRDYSKLLNVVSIVKPVPTNGSKPYAYVMVVIGEKFFTNILNSISNSSYAEIYITNNDGDIISTNTRNRKYSGLISKDYLESQLNKKIYNKVEMYDREKVLVTATTSEAYKWKFISITPYKSLSGDIQIIKNYSIIVSLLSIVLGIFASFFLSTRISRSINKIIRLFRNESGTVDEKDVFKYIEMNVNRLVKNKESIEQSLDEHMPVLRNNYLTGILLGDSTDRAGIEERFGYYGINLEIDADYMVYVISMGNKGCLSGKYTERQISMMLVYMMGVIDDLISRENQGIVINTRPDELAIVLLIPAGICKEEVRQKVAGLGDDIIKSIFNITTCKMHMAASNSYNEISQLFLAYNEATEALEYHAFAGESDIIFYEDIKSIKEESYSYPLIKEDDLLSALRKGNPAEVMEKNKAIFKAFASLNGTNKVMVCYMQLLSSAIRIAYEARINAENELDESKLYSEVLSFKSAFEAQDWFEKLFERILELSRCRKDSKNRTIIDAVEKYICDNYEKDLSLTTLSGMVYMSANYFAKVFKDETSKQVKQYINEVRIEKAKEFLRNPKYKISDVAGAVGYDNMHSFLYLFKGYMGMTPGEYRSSVLQLK